VQPEAAPECAQAENGPLINEFKELAPEAPAQVPPNRSSSASCSEAVEAKVPVEATEHPPSEHKEQSASAVPPAFETLDTDPADLDEDEDQMDELEIWAVNAPGPPDQAYPTEAQHFRVMAPPRADPLPSADPFPPFEESAPPPEEEREVAPAEEAEAELDAGEASRVPVKAMPSNGPSWPVGKAAASRFKAPPATLSAAIDSGASSSDTRRDGSDGGQVPSSFAEASSATASSVKAPPAHRSAS